MIVKPSSLYRPMFSLPNLFPSCMNNVKSIITRHNARISIRKTYPAQSEDTDSCDCRNASHSRTLINITLAELVCSMLD
jgi:hypothetical protein